MFYTIPSKSSEIRTNTPIGVKSIIGVFFENKNDNAYSYKKELESVSISIDGKQICRNLLILPFSTNVPFGGKKHKWQDVALEVNLNVNLSEIKITSSGNNNDYNIVFVCSDKNIDESKGFDFIETKKVRLKGVLSYKEAESFLAKTKEDLEAKYQKALNDYNQQEELYNQYQKDLAKYKQYLDDLAKYYQYLEDVRLYEQYVQDEIAYQEYLYQKQLWDEYQEWLVDTNPDKGEEPEHPESEPQEVEEPQKVEQPKEIIERPEEVAEPKIVERGTEPKEPTEIVVEFLNKGEVFTYKWDFDEADIVKCIDDIDVGETTIGEELQFTFDKEPIAVVCFPMFSVKGSSIISNIIANYNFNFSGTDNEVFPPKTDLSIISINKNIPFRKALYHFDDKINRSATITLNNNAKPMETYENNKIGDMEVYFLFLYKKIV